MKKIIKNQYKNILIVLGYIAVALAVYITMTISFKLAWWIILLISLAIIIVGAVIGYFFIKGEMKTQNNNEPSGENNKD